MFRKSWANPVVDIFSLLKKFGFFLRFFSMLASTKTVRGMVFCSPCTHARDHQNTCYIVWVWYDEYMGTRINIFAVGSSVYGNTVRVRSEYCHARKSERLD